MGTLLEDTTILGQLLPDRGGGGGDDDFSSMLPLLALSGQGQGSDSNLFSRLLPAILGYMKGGIPGGLMGLFGGGMFGGGQQRRDPIQEQIDRLTAEIDGTPPTRTRKAEPYISSELAEASFMSPEGAGAWMAELPEQMRPGVTASLEQNAAMNRINRQRFADWQNLMRGAYGEAMGGFEQMRGMYA